MCKNESGTPVHVLYIILALWRIEWGGRPCPPQWGGFAALRPCVSEHPESQNGAYCIVQYDGDDNGIVIQPLRRGASDPFIGFNGLWKSSPDGIPRISIEAGGESFHATSETHPDLFWSDGHSYGGFLPLDDEARFMAAIHRSEKFRYTTNGIWAEVSTRGLSDIFLYCSEFMNAI